MENLRSKDNETKKIVLIFSSALVMIIVAFVWLKYFDTLIQPLDSLLPEEKTKVEEGFSFFETIKAGLAVIYDSFKNSLESLRQILGRPRDYIIEPDKK